MQGNSTLVSLKEIVPVREWEEFLQHGKDYLRTGTAAYAQHRKAFTPEVLYNLTAMAIEKFVMAAVFRQGDLPYNHTMSDLVEAMDRALPGRIDEIRQDLLNLDRYQEICDLDAFSIQPPNMDEIPAMLALAKRLQDLVTEEVVTPGRA